MVHQYGRRFFLLEHQYSRRDVILKTLYCNLLAIELFTDTVAILNFPPPPPSPNPTPTPTPLSPTINTDSFLGFYDVRINKLPL